MIKKIKKGCKIDDIINFLKDIGYNKEEAFEYISLLIENKILVSEMEPDIFNHQYFNRLINQLKNNPKLKTSISQLQKSIKEFLDDNNINSVHDAVQTIENKIKETGITLNRKHFLHANQYKKPVEGIIDGSYQQYIINAIEFLSKWNKSKIPHLLDQFRSRYLDVYGEIEMPLLQVMDAKDGLGYPVDQYIDNNSLTDNFNFRSDLEKNITLDDRDQLLLDEITKPVFTYSLDITAFSDRISNESFFLPASFSAIFKITDFKKRQMQIDAVGNSSAINLIARFSEVHTAITNHIKEIQEHEYNYNSDYIIAEINHLPADPVANVLNRPEITGYQIPIILHSTGFSQQIALNDLFLSVRNDQIILRSKTLDKIIIPRISSAHNYNISELPVYRFLGDLQHQYNSSGISYSWSPVFAYFKFLPRIALGEHIILHPAEWRFNKQDVSYLIKDIKNINQNDILKFKQKWRLPQYVILADDDLELFVDFQNIITVQCWLQTIKERKNFVLKEFLFDPETPIKDKHNKRYHHEFICTVFNHRNEKLPFVNPRSFGLNKAYPPGSEWIYVKLYGNPTNQNQVLTQFIKPFIGNKEIKSNIKTSFFIRYKDQFDHLRIRFNLNYNGSHSLVSVHLKNLLDELLENNLIWKVVHDTYQPEYFRYGQNLVYIFEQIFDMDSQMILELLEQADGSKLFYLNGLKLIDSYCSAFDLGLEEKLLFCKKVKDSFYDEFSVNKEQKLAIDKDYRKYNNEIERILSAGYQSTPFKNRFKQLKQLTQQLLCYASNEEKQGFLQDFIHLSLNRLINIQQREHEMMLYDFISRYYHSTLVRKNLFKNHVE